jgi:hypothetical protein
MKYLRHNRKMKPSFSLKIRPDWKRLNRLVLASLIVVLLLTQSLTPSYSGVKAAGVRAAPLPAPLGGPTAQWGYQSPEPYYSEVLREYESNGYQPTRGVHIDLPGTQYSAISDNAVVQSESGLGGNPGEVLVWDEGDGRGWVEWTFDVPATGLYNLAIDYYPLPGKRASVQRELLIDGQYPFIEARRLSFERNWKDAHVPKRDNQGHDIRPSQVEAPVWRVQLFEDALAMYRAPYLFYLDQGQHTVRLGVIREPLAIASISLISPPEVLPYQQTLDQLQASGAQPTQGVMVVIEAEEAEYKSTPTLTRNYSPNPSAFPLAEGQFRLNVFGGWRWRRANERASWRFSVP